MSDGKVWNDNPDAPVSIDEGTEFVFRQSTKVKQQKYKCTCCGASWTKQEGHFSKSSSPLYQSNGGYINICNGCRDKYYARLVSFYKGNEGHAIRHFCCQFDVIFHQDALAASRSHGGGSRISAYLKRRNLGQTAQVGRTFTDGMKHLNAHSEKRVVETKEQARSGDSQLSMASVDRWGVGFSEVDYKNLDEHYKMLKRNNPNCDNNQEIFIKSLCNINMLMMRALKEGDSDRYVKLTEQYSKTFTKAGLTTVQEADASEDETLGVTLAAISKYTPEAYYKDKKLYADFDGIGEYFDRFVKRPLKNLMTGSDERDAEYSVGEDGWDAEE